MCASSWCFFSFLVLLKCGIYFRYVLLIRPLSSIDDSHIFNSTEKSRPQVAWPAKSSATILSAQGVRLCGDTYHALARVAMRSQGLVAGGSCGEVGTTTLNVSNCYFTTIMLSTKLN